MSMMIPTAISASPTQSSPEAYVVVPTMSSPEKTPITTETRVSCISLIVIIIVNSRTAPKTSMTTHCTSEGTTSLEAGKKMGKPMLHKKINWCAIVQGLLSLSLNTYELTQPRMRPGRNSHSLLTEQFFSISKDPTIISPKKSPYIPILLPRVISQKMAKIMPPDPFQPKCMLSSILASESTQSILSLLSKLSTGRQGMSSCLRMIQVQLITKAVRLVTKEY